MQTRIKKIYLLYFYPFIDPKKILLFSFLPLFSCYKEPNTVSVRKTITHRRNWCLTMDNDQIDYYKTLGIERNANTDDIKQAFRLLSRKHHPDRNPDDPTATVRFQKISQSYETLVDTEKRKIYDESVQQCDVVSAVPFSFTAEDIRESMRFRYHPEKENVTRNSVGPITTNSNTQNTRTTPTDKIQTDNKPGWLTEIILWLLFFFILRFLLTKCF